MPIIVTGNPADGFTFIGPFESPSEAIEWATNHVTAEWWQMDTLSAKEWEDL